MSMKQLPLVLTLRAKNTMGVGTRKYVRGKISQGNAAQSPAVQSNQQETAAPVQGNASTTEKPINEENEDLPF